MKLILLFPNYFKKVGWTFVVLAAVVWFCSEIMDLDMGFLTIRFPSIYADNVGENLTDGWFAFLEQEMTYTLFSVLLIVGGLILLFTKEKVEDEFIRSVRYSSMLWAVSFNYIFLLFAFLGVYGPAFINIVIYNVYSVILIYVLRFNYLLFINKRQMAHEE